jgi:hypothetical protein
MKPWLTLLARLLPPYNLARLFSYTRELEALLEQPCPVCDLKDERIAELREELRLKENYTLSRLNAPPVHVEKKQPHATVLGVRPSLRRVRRRAAAAAWLKAEEGKANGGDDMAARADEYAAEVNEN